MNLSAAENLEQEAKVRAVLQNAEEQISIIIGREVIINSYKVVKEEVMLLITTEDIKTIVCEVLSVDRSLLEAPKKTNELVFARFISIKFIYDLNPKISLKSIGKMFGDRDHSTIIHALQTHQDMMDTDKAYKLWYQEVYNRINQLIFYKKQQTKNNQNNNGTTN